jgi:hypothetical protein
MIKLFLCHACNAQSLINDCFASRGLQVSRIHYLLVYSIQPSHLRYLVLRIGHSILHAQNI